VQAPENRSFLEYSYVFYLLKITAKLFYYSYLKNHKTLAQNLLKTCSKPAQNLLKTCSKPPQNLLKTCSKPVWSGLAGAVSIVTGLLL
jgi:hypothetical protein